MPALVSVGGFAESLINATGSAYDNYQINGTGPFNTLASCGAQVGDLALVTITLRGSSTAPHSNGTGGLTLKDSYVGSSNCKQWLWFKVITAADLTAGNYWQWSMPRWTSSGWTVVLDIYRNQSVATPLGATGHYTTGTNQLIADSISATMPGSKLYVAWNTDYAGGTIPGSMTARRNTFNGGAVYSSDESVGVGATGTRTMATGNSGGGQTAMGVIINPQNSAPNAPALTGPANNSTVDRNITQRFSWLFSDPDAGDAQSQFDIQVRNVVGPGAWIPASGITANQFLDMPPGTFGAGTWEWQVRTYDSLGAVGPWSVSSFVTMADPPATPTITSPVSGGTVSDSNGTVAWTTPAQTDYQVRKVADNAGSPDTNTVYYDSGIVTSSGTRSVLLAFPTNNRWEHVQVRVKANGLWSTWASVRTYVSYTPPTSPILLAIAMDGSAAIQVSITNPTANILTDNDASLETSVGSWFAGASNTVARSTTQSMTGSGSLAVTATAAVAEVYGALYAGPGVCTPGSIYTAVASLRAAGTARRVGIRLDWTMNGAYVTSTYTNFVTDNAFGWRQLAISAICPAGANSATLVVSIYSVANAEVHYIDGAALYPDPSANITPGGGDFEYSLSPWAPVGGSAPTVSLSTDRAQCGLVSAKVAWVTGSSGGNAGFTANVYGYAGKTYTLSAWVFCTVTGARLSVYGTAVTTASSSSATLGSWQRLSLTFTCIANGGYAVQLDTGGATGAGAITYIDGVQLVEKPSATTFIPFVTQNLITNPTFESASGDMTGWGWAGATAAIADLPLPYLAASGSRVAKITPTAVDSYLAQRVNVPNVATASGTVKISVSGTITMMAAQAASGLDSRARKIVVYTFDANGTFVGGYESTQPANVAGSTRVVMEDISVPSGGGAEIRFYNGSPSDIVYWDAVQAEYGKVATPYFDGSTGSDSSWEAAETWIPAATASFEDGNTTGWTSANGTLSNSSTRAVVGTKSLLLTIASGVTNGNAFARMGIPGLVVGQIYTFSAWTYIGSLGGATGVTWRWVNAAQNAVIQNANNLTIVGSWQRVSITFIATETTAYFDFVNVGATTSAMTVWVDAVQFEERPYPTPYGAGAGSFYSTSRRQKPWALQGPAVTTVDLYRTEAGGVEQRIATGLAPSQLSTYMDYSAASGKTYVYRAVAKASSGTSATSKNAIPATPLALKGIWLHDPKDPAATIHKFPWDGMGRGSTREAEHALADYVGRTLPVVEFGTGERQAVDANLALDNETGDIEAMDLLFNRKTTLLYRDGRGRKLYGTISSLKKSDESYGQMMSFSFEGTDYTETA